MIYTNEVDERLRVLLGACHEDTLQEVMSYSVFAGGKRLRPNLLLAACEAVCGHTDEPALDFACAVEMIHTYSLIHDDLPAMDDDDYRRGKLTSHKVYGEASAILAGDALLSLACEVMARVCLEKQGRRSIEAMYTVIRAAGADGMVAGQMADMQWENKKADGSTLIDIQRRKTGALIAASLTAGALLGGGSPTRIRVMKELGRLVGCAFQIRDDILDVTATTEALGKPAHSDEKNHKNTYVTVFGMEQAEADYQKLSGEALALFKRWPPKTDVLREMIVNIIDREY